MRFSNSLKYIYGLTGFILILSILNQLFTNAKLVGLMERLLCSSQIKITELILTCVEFSTDVLVASEVSLTK